MFLLDLINTLTGANKKQQPSDGAAQRYEAAFARGDLNSPDIIGKDPAAFGYPADEMRGPTMSLPRTGRVMPGFERGAADYEQSFTQGRPVAPQFARTDPSNYGYPADEPQNYAGYQVGPFQLPRIRR